MPRCRCGSYAINIDDKEEECDVCYYKNRLGDLLAILHGDGGHYIAIHGYDKAIEDAKDIYYNLRIENNDTNNK